MKCKLYPFKRKDIATIQELKQIPGWQITAFNIPEVWNRSQGDGVIIAVIDTGCDLDHPDLVDNLLPGFNVINPAEPPEDDNNHGTHICGAICAENNEYGIVGVAPAAKIVPIKVLDATGCGDMGNVAKGVRVATEMGVDMMCISIGCGKPLATLRRAVQAAERKGIPIFCAGGNVKKEFDSLYPARYPETIAIAAVDKNQKRAAFSNTAISNIDFLAPGVDILSTITGGWYAVLSGSSMAVPFVAGVAALALSAKRKYGLKVGLNSVDSYRTMLKKYGVDKYSGEDMFAGYGVISPTKLMRWLEADPEI